VAHAGDALQPNQLDPARERAGRSGRVLVLAGLGAALPSSGPPPAAPAAPAAGPAPVVPTDPRPLASDARRVDAAPHTPQMVGRLVQDGRALSGVQLRL
jgi:hypothetical protein